MWVPLAGRSMAPADELAGADGVLALADRMRRSGCPVPYLLYHECVQAFKRGEIPFDEVTPLYKHATIHAGAVIPLTIARFEVCPTCQVPLWTSS